MYPEDGPRPADALYNLYDGMSNPSQHIKYDQSEHTERVQRVATPEPQITGNPQSNGYG